MIQECRRLQKNVSPEAPNGKPNEKNYSPNLPSLRSVYYCHNSHSPATELLRVGEGGQADTTSAHEVRPSRYDAVIPQTLWDSGFLSLSLDLQTQGSRLGRALLCRRRFLISFKEQSSKYLKMSI